MDSCAATGIRGTVVSPRFIGLLAVRKSTPGERVMTDVAEGKSFQRVTATAVSASDLVIRPGRQSGVTESLGHFTVQRNAIFTMRYDLILDRQSIDDCATYCLSTPLFYCQTLSYSYSTGECFLNSALTDEHPDRVQNSSFTDLYTRIYTDRFEEMQGQVLVGSDGSSISNIASSNLCARECVDTTNATCKSFNYCQDTQSCQLLEVHRLEVSAESLVGSSCAHYSRKYIDDFYTTPATTMSSGYMATINESSAMGCGKACAESSGVRCWAFTFCGTTCTMFSVHPSQAKVKRMGSCTLYSLPLTYHTYIQESHCSSGSGGPQGSHQCNPDTTAYTGGSMAGLAFGLLFLGLIVGATFLYFFKVRNTDGGSNEIKMVFVNSRRE